MKNTRPLHRFMLGVLLYFPLAFFLWYTTAKYHLAPAVVLSDWVIDSLFPGALQWLRLDNHILVVASNFGENAMGAIVSPPVGDNLMGFHINPLVYSYSMPLFVALALAVPGQGKWLKCLWGLLLLLPVEVFSMVFSVLRVLTFNVGAAFQLQYGLGQFDVDMIALAYQAGSLVLPMIAPLVIWIALHRDFLLKLAPHLQKIFK